MLKQRFRRGTGKENNWSETELRRVVLRPLGRGIGLKPGRISFPSLLGCNVTRRDQSPETEVKWGVKCGQEWGGDVAQGTQFVSSVFCRS